MTWALRTGCWIVPLFGLLLVPLAWLEVHGFVSEAIIEMWSRAIVQIEGPQVFRATDAFYPPLPYALALALQGAAPDIALPVPSLLSAALGAVLLYAWFWNLRERGSFDAISALLIVALLAMNPFFLRALAEGPSTIMLMLGFWIYARGLLNLRLNGAAPDMMKVAVGLLLMPLSHAYGMLLAVGTLPFIVIAARPSMLASSPFGYLVSMFFPVVAAIGSLVFVNAVLKTEFFSTHAMRGGASSDPLAHWPLLAGLLLLPAALVRLARMPRFYMPLLAAAGSLLGGAFLNVGYGFGFDPVIVAVPALGLVVVAIRAWPSGPFRVPIVAALLVATTPLGIWSIYRSGAAESLRFLAASAGTTVADPREADRRAAAFLAGRSDILADVEQHPGLVTTLGDVSGFLVAGDPAYDMTLEGGRPRGSYIAVRHEPGQNVQDDRLLRAIPELATGTVPPFELRYEYGGWRIFEIVH